MMEKSQLLILWVNNNYDEAKAIYRYWLSKRGHLPREMRDKVMEMKDITDYNDYIGITKLIRLIGQSLKIIEKYKEYESTRT